jgi:hypothetical protein
MGEPRKRVSARTTTMSSDEAIPRIPDLECTSLEFLLSVNDAAVRTDAAAKLLEKVKTHGGLRNRRVLPRKPD